MSDSSVPSPTNGTPVAWEPRPLQPLGALRGRTVSLHRMEPERDAEEFHARLGGRDNAPLWRFIPMGPFANAEQTAAFFRYACEQLGWTPYLFRGPGNGRLLGTASHMRVRPEAGSAEVGAVIFSPEMQRTASATEAMYWMARHVFEDGRYRRYEWKCDASNEASRRAALRLGFRFEGIFRQDMVVRGYNRDTAWFSLLDREWPAARAAFEAWLAPDNFDAEGRQRRPLASLRTAEA